MAIKNLEKIKHHLFLCNGGTCKSKGAENFTIAVREAIEKEGLSDEIHTTKTLCNGRCNDGPIVIVQPDNLWYKNMEESLAEELVAEHLIKGKVLEPNLLFEWRQ